MARKRKVPKKERCSKTRKMAKVNSDSWEHLLTNKEVIRQGDVNELHHIIYGGYKHYIHWCGKSKFHVTKIIDKDIMYSHILNLALKNKTHRQCSAGQN